MTFVFTGDVERSIPQWNCCCSIALHVAFGGNLTQSTRAMPTCPTVNCTRDAFYGMWWQKSIANSVFFTSPCVFFQHFPYDDSPHQRPLLCVFLAHQTNEGKHFTWTRSGNHLLIDLVWQKKKPKNKCQSATRDQHQRWVTRNHINEKKKPNTSGANEKVCCLRDARNPGNSFVSVVQSFSQTNPRWAFVTLTRASHDSFPAAAQGSPRFPQLSLFACSGTPDWAGYLKKERSHNFHSIKANNTLLLSLLPLLTWYTYRLLPGQQWFVISRWRTCLKELAAIVVLRARFPIYIKPVSLYLQSELMES